MVPTNIQNVQDAAFGITDSLEELEELGLVQYVPVSVIAFAAIPLMLHVLDIQLSSSTDFPQTVIKKRQRLHVLLEVMKAHRPRYDCVEVISRAVQHVVVDEFHHLPWTGSTTAKDWTDVLLQHPMYYVRLTLTIDLTLRNARIPENRDLLLILKSLYHFDSNTCSVFPPGNPRNTVQKCHGDVREGAQERQCEVVPDDHATTITIQSDPCFFDDCFLDECLDESFKLPQKDSTVAGARQGSPRELSPLSTFFQPTASTPHSNKHGNNLEIFGLDRNNEGYVENGPLLEDALLLETQGISERSQVQDRPFGLCALPDY